MKILITGGAGFIGSHFVRYSLETHPDLSVVILDKLTYAGRKENLHDVWDSVRFIQGDICVPADVDKAMEGCEMVFHFAAESHVDRSITGAGAFVHTNVWGSYVLLEAARRHGIARFIQISTDEVYGSCVQGSFSEGARANPSSPYAASKASADMLVLAYGRTYGVPVLITRSANNFGPYQYPEKAIPLFITNALEGTPLPVYGDGRHVRDWIYVQENCAAIDFVAHHGTLGEIYNIAAKNERENLAIVEQILHVLNQPRELIRFVQDRPGHDRRYSVDVTKLTALGWASTTPFPEALAGTIHWYQDNEWWWKPLKP
jgi:dTDP-glucose 4,6-dehydratase